MRKVPKSSAASGKAPPSRRSPSDVDVHLAGLRSRDGLARERARRALTSLGKASLGHLIQLLGDPDPQVRWEAAKALVDIPDPRTAPALVVALEDRAYGVRWLAAVGLVAIGRDALVPLLETLKARSGSVWLQAGAHHVLHDLAKRDTESRDLLAPVLAGLDGMDPQEEVLQPIDATLARIGRTRKGRG